MMKCSKCGKEIEEGKEFCSHCGASVAQEESKDSTSTQVTQTTVPETPGDKELKTPRRSRKTMIAVAAGIGGILVITAVVLVLLLVVFAGEGPADVVGKYFKLAETKNANELMKIVDNDYFKNDKELGKAFKEEVFQDVPSNMKFTGLKYETKQSKDTAKVEVIKGSAKYSENGKEKTLDLSKPEEKKTFLLVEKEDKWYISPTSFGDILAKEYKNRADTTFDSLDKSVDMMWGCIKKINEGKLTSQDAGPYRTIAQGLAEGCAADSQGLSNQYQSILGLTSGEKINDYRQYAELKMQLLSNLLKQSDLIMKAINAYCEKNVQALAECQNESTGILNEWTDLDNRAEGVASRL